ncbi:MAG: hypothetical protein HUJ30_00905 [Gammaproteobacteria bacterium]|nr:hypothetical protein [Gammaproteobacteria bacterium]
MDINMITQYALMLLDASQWHALVVMLLVVSLATEQIKRVFYMRLPKRKKRRRVYATSSLLAMVASVVGYLVDTTGIELWFWLFTASTVGPVANALHKVTLAVIAWKWPALADALKGKPT